MSIVGVRNYLVDGGSGSGKTAVAGELQRRGYQAIHGDRELKADQELDTAEQTSVPARHLPPLWDVDKVKAFITDKSEPLTFLCGGCRNSSQFIELLDGVFVLEVPEIEIIMRRIDQRVALDPKDWGGRPEEREIIKHLHETKIALAPGQAIDASLHIEQVVDKILSYIQPPSDE